MSQFQDTGRQLITSNERIADALYQRKSGALEMVPPALKQIVLFTELIVQNQKLMSAPGTMERMKTWQDSFTRLSEALKEEDGILTADILHHEINAQLNEWVA